MERNVFKKWMPFDFKIIAVTEVITITSMKECELSTYIMYMYKLLILKCSQALKKLVTLIIPRHQTTPNLCIHFEFSK